MKSKKLKIVVIVCVLALFITGGIFLGKYLFNRVKVYTVSMNSMEPALNKGDSIIVRESSKYEVNDIILAKCSVGDIVKRIVAVDGDKLKFYGNYYTKNGVKVEDTYCKLADYSDFIQKMKNYPEYKKYYGSTDECEFIVPEGFLFVMGDNRNVSNDSRDIDIGFMSVENIKGKIVKVIRP